MKLKFVGLISIAIIVPHMLVAGAASEFSYTLELLRSDLRFGTFGEYDVVTMRNSSIASDIGKPVLPEKHVGIAIPAGHRALRVEARSVGAQEIPGEFVIMPGQPPVQIGQMQDGIVVEPDAEIYGSNVAYPGQLASLDYQGNIAGQQIVWIKVYPVQFRPREGKVVFHDRIELNITHAPYGSTENPYVEKYHTFTEHQRRLYEDMVKNMVSNPEHVIIRPEPGVPSMLLPPGEYTHVVITSSALAPYFEPLVQWHTQKGYKDTVVTTEWIYANYTGPGDTLQIRQFVIDANSTWGTMYFLMGGEGSIVPFCRRYYYGEYPDQITPSDQYYSDYDSDWIHEVFVGRASVESEAEANIFINKVLKYEKDPPLNDYACDMLLIGMDLNPSTHSEDLKEAVASYVPGYFDINKVYDSHAGNHRDSAIYYWNEGMNLVNHSDHCNVTLMGIGSENHGWHITNTDVDGLTNDNEPCIIVSDGCEPNAMDYNDCIAEHWVIYNDNQAGIAFNGNTRHGWGYVGSPASLSGELDLWWWYGLFAQNQEDLGKALIYAKHSFSAVTGIRAHCEWTFNLLGEPAMPIWTNTPDILQVTYDPFVGATPGTYTVTVKDNDGVTPVENALVCCWVRDQTPQEMYETGYTSAAGQAMLNIDPTTPGDTMFITVTAQNYLYYEGYALVTVTSGPFIVTGTMLLDTGGDGQPNPGEAVDFGIYAKNIGVDPVYDLYGLLSSTDPYVTAISVDSSWYNDIGADGDSALSNPYYDFTIADDCPDAHIIDFTLEFHDQHDSIWIAYPAVTVFAPRITYQGVTVINGYWDNGMLDPNEAAELVVSLMNEGTAIAENVTATLLSSSPGISIVDGSGSYGAIDPGNTADNASDPYTVYASSSIAFGTSVDFSLALESGVYFDTVDFSLIVGAMPPTDTGYYYAYYSGGAYAQAPVFDWVAIDSTQSTYPGVSLDLDRNETVVIDLPFTFTYYGIDYDRISISSNGWIAMDSTESTDYSNSAIPFVDGPPAMIAGIWDYLHPGNPGEPSDIYYYYDQTNHRFIVEYFMVEHYPSGGNHETFEIILHDPEYYPTPSGDGEILVQYLTGFQLEGSLTMGIENADETVGLQYYFNGTYDSLAAPVTDAFAVKYVASAPMPGVEEEEEYSIAPMKTLLNLVAPNPFTHRTTITYQLSKAGSVSLKAYDATGRLVRTFEDGTLQPGHYAVVWDGNDDTGRRLAAGVYFVKLEVADYERALKAVLLR